MSKLDDILDAELTAEDLEAYQNDKFNVLIKKQLKDLIMEIIEMPIENEVKQFNGIELNAYMYAFKVLKEQLRQKVEEL